MKKVSLLILVSLILLLTFASCTILDELMGKTPETPDECAHEWSAATCTAPKTCTKCNATEGEAAGHDWADATCVTAKTCKTCNEVTGLPVGHAWVEATCSTPKTCSNCGETVGSPAAHLNDIVLEGVAATCTTDGLTEGKKCSACDTVTVAQQTIPAAHTWVEATCTAPKTCSVCNTTEGDPAPHTEVDIPGREPTCVEDGVTAGKECSVCHTVTVAPQPIPSAGGHMAMPEETEEGTAPTCTQPGVNYTVVYCFICGEEISRVEVPVPAVGHNVPNYTPNNDATCTVDGTKTGECTICHETVTVTDEGTAYGHKMPETTACGDTYVCANGCGETLGPREHSMAPATCTAPSTCTNCGYEEEGTILPHTPGTPTEEDVVAPGCETPGSYNEVTRCTVCGAVTASVAKTTDPTGHNMAPATCDNPSTCENGCGKTEGEAVANHTPVPNFDGTALTYTCTTCNDTFTTDQLISYTGNDKSDLFFTKNGDPSVSIVDGAYSIKAGEQRSQYMIYGPSNDKNHANTMTGWNSTNESFGVFSFRMQPGTITETMRVIIMSSRNNPNWDKNQQTLGTSDGWGANSLDILGIMPNGDGTFKITGYDITSNVLASVNGTDWVDIKMFIQINKDGVLTISYYINDAFVNTYTYDLLNPEAKKSILNLDINNFYMCGWTAPGTGFAIDDMFFGYQKNSEWLFDEHEHRWVDADCENAKHCSACGLVYEGSTALGHTEATRDINVVAPDCVNDGSHDVETYCTVCQKVFGTEHVVDTATGHTLDENNVCTVCGTDLHECNLVAAEVIAPTCTVGGYTVYRCDHANCNKNENRDFTDPTGHSMQAATCTAPKTCSVCGHTEGNPTGHSYTVPTCAVAATCTVCGDVKGTPSDVAHNLTSNYTGSTLTYNCSVCDYSFKVDTFDYSDGTNYNGMHANASQNNTVYTTNGSNYPVQKDGYLEFIRTDAEANAQKQLQMWLPSANGGTNKFSGFTAASNSIGYLAFKVDAKTDVNFEMKLVDHRVDSVNGENIRWGDKWAINDPVFRVRPAADGKTEFRGFNGISLGKFTVDADGFTGWVDVAIQIVLDPNTDKVIAHYYINGAYVATSSRDLTTHTDAIQGVYLNFNSKAAGCGYRIDNLTFGYSAHKHDLVPTVVNGVLTYACDCGTDFVINSEVREWNGDGSDSALKNVPNGNVELTTNAQGQYEYIFKPYTDTAPDFSADGTQSGDGWFEYDKSTYAGGQLQMWMPSNNRDTNTLAGFSCENDAVGVISFNVKTNLSRHPDWDTSLTFSVGKPRNASDWNDGGSWTDDSINIFTIEEYQASGIVVKGGLNGTNLNLTTIPVTEDGWSEWFNVMIVIEMTKEEYINVYYYINGALLGTDTRDLNNPGGARTLNPKKIEALQISGWTYVPNTGIVFDDFYFGYSANGHNTLDGHVHNITETTCGEKSTCSCGWTGYTVAHTFATACAPACSVCGLANNNAAAHANLVSSVAGGNVTYHCADCNYCYNVKSENLLTLANVSDATSAGLYEKTYTGTSLKMINNGTDANAQHQFWFPGQSEAPQLAGFTNANGATGFLSFKINAKDHHNTGIEFKVNANRGTNDWGGPSNNGWSESSVGIFRLAPWAADATSIKLTGYNGTELGYIDVTGENGWSGWIDVVVVMHLNKDNTITVEYYINGSLFKTLHADFVIWTHEINSLYINGRTNGAGQGYELTDLYFGYAADGATKYVAPLYKEVIEGGKEALTDEALKTIVDSKIKQCDQTSAPNVEGGTPVYVIAEGKDGEDVEALYISRTYAWTTETVHFTEFRFAVNGENKSGPATISFSFDYKIDGTVETNDRYTFTDLEGNNFSADAYVQIKTAADHPLAGDNYPELSGTDLILDGEWHTMTYTFDDPLVIIDILLNLYHFQGEMLIANLVVTPVA